jgi:hypothetical protein
MALSLTLFELEVIGWTIGENLRDWLQANIQQLQHEGGVMYIILPDRTPLFLTAIVRYGSAFRTTIRVWVQDATHITPLCHTHSRLILQDLICVLERRGCQVRYWDGVFKTWD